MFPENRYWRCRRDGRLFHKKARSPMVERRVLGTRSDDVDAERRRWRASSADDWWSSSARYGAAVWCRQLYTRTASLNFMCSGTFRSVRSGVMRSYLDAASSRIQHRLHPFGKIGWNATASQRCVTIIQPLQNERRNSTLRYIKKSRLKRRKCAKNNNRPMQNLKTKKLKVKKAKSSETSDCRTERGTERRILRSWCSIAKQAATVFETCDLIDTSASM